MDIYTVAFSVPLHHLPAPGHRDGHGAAHDPYGAAHANGAVPGAEPQLSTTPSDAEAVQKLAMNVMSLHGCHVSFAVAEQGRGWNFLVSGAYQQVMMARGMIMKDCPYKVRPRSTRQCPPRARD